MAYPYYPNNYTYGYPQVQQQIQPQIQNGGFVRVANEDEAHNYPVAPGYSVTFIDDSASYCYTKTAGFSQFDKPVFKKYRLIAEDGTPQENTEMPEYALKTELDKLKAEFKKLKSKVEKSDD